MSTVHKYMLPHGYYVGPVQSFGHKLINTVDKAPDQAEIEMGFWPRWPIENPDATDWDYVENLKGEHGFVDGEPRNVIDYGPPPAGWRKTPPPPTQAERDARRRAEILVALAEIDAASVRPLRAVANGDASQVDIDKLAELDAEAAIHRAELAALPAA